MYVAICRGNGKFNGWFVAPSGSQHSYVKDLQNAKTWPTREASESETCENEFVHNVRDLMQA